MKSIGAFAAVMFLAVTVRATPRDTVTISVFGLFHPNQLVVETTPSHVLVLTAEGHEFVIGAGGPQRVVLSRSGQAITLRSRGIAQSANLVKFAGRGKNGEFVLALPGKLQRVYRGQLTVIVEGQELVPTVTMDLETAVASIVAAEMPRGAPIEALKAQAVVSRSYLVAGGPRHAHADFCDTTHCQFLRHAPKPDSAASQTAAATAGLVLAWREKPFAAMFSSSCGGKTHSLAEIGYPGHDYPFFSVECAYCRRSPERWSSTLAPDTATVTAKDEPGRIKTGRMLGWKAVPSPTFQTRVTGGGAELNGVGRGHGVGLCQKGAVGMARDGKNFRTILGHYFPNATIQAFPQH